MSDSERPRAMRNMRRRVGREFLQVIVVMLIVVTSASERAYGQISALQMRQFCQGIKTTEINGEISLDVRKYPDVLTCYGAFTALSTAIRTLGEGEIRASFFLPDVCAFQNNIHGVDLPLLVAVFAHFVDEHPERGGDDFFYVAWVAFKTAWPCKK